MITLVTTFVNNYPGVLYAALVFGIGAFVLSRLMKAGKL